MNACATLPLRPYSIGEERRAADEIDAAPASAMLPRLAMDFGELRAAVAACKGGR